VSHNSGVEGSRKGAQNGIVGLREAVSKAYQQLEQTVARGSSERVVSQCAHDYASAVSLYRTALQELVVRKETEKVSGKRRACEDSRWRAAQSYEDDAD